MTNHKRFDVRIRTTSWTGHLDINVNEATITIKDTKSKSKREGCQDIRIILSNDGITLLIPVEESEE